MSENLQPNTFKKPSKIFVIGFNKTGTTSINKLLQLSNIKSIHTLIPVMKIIDKYDAFTDGDHFNFEKVDFPLLIGSNVLLNVIFSLSNNYFLKKYTPTQM